MCERLRHPYNLQIRSQVSPFAQRFATPQPVRLKPWWGPEAAIAVISDPTERGETADGSWMAWTAVGLGGIWIAVVLISVFAPDMISGSEQEHLPIAAFTTWFWGGAGSLVFLWAMGKLRGNARWRSTWIGLAAVTLVGMGARDGTGYHLPVFVTGTDPTQISIGAFFSPVAAAMLTALAGVVAGVFRRSAPEQ
jgi:hypothetical protein